MNKFKKYIKKIVPFVLVGVIVSSAVMVNYDKARTVKAVAGVDDAVVIGLITTLLLSFGYVTTSYFNDTDGANALADSWEEEYNKSRFNVLNGGASGGGDDDNNDDDWEDTDGDGKITEKDIPEFSQLYTASSSSATGAKVAALVLGANGAKLLKPIITKFAKSRFGSEKTPTNVDNIKSMNSAINDYCLANDVDLSGYQYYSVKYYGNVITKIYSNNAYAIDNGTSYRVSGDGIQFLYSVIKKEITSVFNNGSDSVKKNDSSTKFWYSNIPIYSSSEKYKDDVANNRIDWVTPDLQNTFDNNSNLELLPAYDTNYNYNMASLQALQQLLSNLSGSALSMTEQQALVNQYIQSLKTDTKTNPDTSTDPEPEPSPKPNPDTPDEDKKNDTDVDKGSFTRDLKALFPFCIPFDLVDCFRLFNSKPETPCVKFPIHFGIVDKDYTFVIDLKDFDNVALVCRSMFLILFIVGLVLATRSLIRG